MLLYRAVEKFALSVQLRSATWQKIEGLAEKYGFVSVFSYFARFLKISLCFGFFQKIIDIDYLSCLVTPLILVNCQQ